MQCVSDSDFGEGLIDKLNHYDRRITTGASDKEGSTGAFCLLLPLPAALLLRRPEPPPPAAARASDSLTVISSAAPQAGPHVPVALPPATHASHSSAGVLVGSHRHQHQVQSYCWWG
jgi:hypothetical protein